MIDVQVYIHTGHDIRGIIILSVASGATQERLMLTQLIWLTKHLQVITHIFSSLSSVIYSFPPLFFCPSVFLNALF